jgi:hypothetical protein
MFWFLKKKAEHKYQIMRSCQSYIEEDGMSCAYHIRYRNLAVNEDWQEIGVLYDSFECGWNTCLKEDAFAIIHKHEKENSFTNYSIEVVL